MQRHVELSDAGADFLITAQQALNVLRAGTARLETYRRPNSISVATSHCFASRWLLPRLKNFYLAHPGLSIWLYTTEQYVDLEVEEVDILITAMNVTGSPSIVKHELFADIVSPVFNPIFLAITRESFGAAKPPMLLHHELPPDWSLWLRQSGLSLKNWQQGPIFSDQGLAASAAASGQGVALVSEILTFDDVNNGVLALVEGPRLNLGRHYQMVSRSDVLGLPNANLFWEWMTREAVQFEAQMLARGAGNVTEITADMIPGGLPHAR